MTELNDVRLTVYDAIDQHTHYTTIDDLSRPEAFVLLCLDDHFSGVITQLEPHITVTMILAELHTMGLTHISPIDRNDPHPVFGRHRLSTIGSAAVTRLHNRIEKRER